MPASVYPVSVLLKEKPPPYNAGHKDSAVALGVQTVVLIIACIVVVLIVSSGLSVNSWDAHHVKRQAEKTRRADAPVHRKTIKTARIPDFVELLDAQGNMGLAMGVVAGCY